MKQILLTFALAFSFLGALPAQAKVFDLPFMKFALPDHWNCRTEKAETLCSSSQAYETKQTAILINAKETTPAETIEIFYQQLAKPKGTGTVKDIKYVQIGDTKWIQAHHVNSELPNYDTIYWMTRENNIAILITYSFASKYSANFGPLAQSFPRSFQLNKAEIDRLSKLARMTQTQQAQPLIATETPTAPKKQSMASKTSEWLKEHYMIPLIALCVILIAVALFLR